MRKHNRANINTYTAKNSFIRLILIKSLIAGIIISNFTGLVSVNTLVQAQQAPIIVTADQPNVWTLEQAHYLLAQMHRRNLDLRAKGLDSLDANAINGIKLDVLKTLLEVGIEYSGENRFNNSQAKSNQIFNSTRRQELIKRNDDLQNQSLQLTQDIALLNIELEKADTQEAKDKINTEIKQKTVVQAKTDKQIEQTNNELKTLNPSNDKINQTSSDSSFDVSKMGGVLDKSFGEAAKKIIENADKPPQLNASLQLDNYLQLQYEIISKQLTLLRDEVGPGERLVFLELPQSINASYDKGDKKWAQSWWKILGYTKTRCQDAGANEIDCPSEPYGLNKRPKSTTETFKSILNPAPRQTYSQYWFDSGDFIDVQYLVSELSKAGKTTTSQYLYDRFPKTTQNLLDEYNNQVIAAGAGAVLPKPQKELISAITNGLNYIISGRSLDQLQPGLFPVVGILAAAPFNTANPGNEVILQLNRKLIENFFNNGNPRIIPANDSIQKISHFEPLIDSATNHNLGNANISNREVRTVDLIPRQSSLNVNDIKLRTRSGALNLVASFLFGFGANLNYQRQHEQYSQFVQQELYSSAFGKGSREFGWTFTPMPGTDRLLSGVRTTYAIVVVPQEATSLIIDSAGCYFRRSDYQPPSFERADNTNFPNGRNSGCSDHKAFVIPIPGGGNESNSNDFFISGLAYNSVKKDNRIVVSIYGENFSSQIGVMINGVPLKQSLGIAQPFIRDDSATGKDASTDLADEKIKGNFERIDAQQMVAAFEMPPDFEGTPTITLVAPGIAIDINRLNNLYINGVRYTSLNDSAFMFGNRPSGAEPVRIDSVEVFPVAGGSLNTLIYGEGFNNCQNLIRNGVITGLAAPFPSKLLSVQFLSNPLDEFLKFTLNCNNGKDIIKSPSVKNPLFKPAGGISAAKPIYDPAKLRIDKVTFISFEDSILVVELEGLGFTESLTPSIGEMVIKSSTDAILQIDPSKASQVVTFTDNKANLFVKAVITRKSPKKEPDDGQNP